MPLESKQLSQPIRHHLWVRSQWCQLKTSSLQSTGQTKPGNSKTRMTVGARMICPTLRSSITKILTSTKWVTSSCNDTSRTWKKNFLKTFWNPGTRVLSTTSALTTPATIRTKNLERTVGMKARTTTTSKMTLHELITLTVYFHLNLIINGWTLNCQHRTNLTCWLRICWPSAQSFWVVWRKRRWIGRLSLAQRVPNKE